MLVHWKARLDSLVRLRRRGAAACFFFLALSASGIVGAQPGPNQNGQETEKLQSIDPAAEPASLLRFLGYGQIWSILHYVGNECASLELADEHRYKAAITEQMFAALINQFEEMHSGASSFYRSMLMSNRQEVIRSMTARFAEQSQAWRGANGCSGEFFEQQRRFVRCEIARLGLEPFSEEDRESCKPY